MALFAAAILGDVNAVAAQLSGGNADRLLKGTNAKGESILHVAAKHGHTELVKYLALKDPMAPFATDLQGRTPLHLAALYGKRDVVVELLKLNPEADRNCVDHNMQTPLHLAALNGHIPAIEELLKQQHDQQLTISDKNGHTALHLAVWRAHVRILQFLLFEAKQISETDRLGWTVVHSAAGVGSVAIIEEIFRICWNSDIRKQVDNTRWSPLHVASWFGHAEIVKLMCGKMGFCVNTTANNLERLTPLHVAAHNGHEAVVDYLLSHEEVQVGSRDVLRRTALHYAARQGHTSVVRKLLKPSRSKALGNSLSVDAMEINGFTALHLAAREGHEQIVSILLKERADVNAKTESSSISKSLLDHVLSSDSPHEMIVDPIILEADCWCINQMTPLHLAARNGHMAVVQQLLKHPNVDVGALDGHGLTPQDWAEVRKVGKGFLACLKDAPQSAGIRSARASKKKLQILREEMMKRDKTAVAMPPSTFHSFQSMQYMAEACEDLVVQVGDLGKQVGKVNDLNPFNNHEKEDTRGVNSDSRSSSEDVDTAARVLQEINEIAGQGELSGNTPLHIAVLRGHKKAVEILVKCGPMDDVNVENSDGYTPLALAFEKNDVEICKLILQNSEKVEDDLLAFLKKAMARNWVDMGILLLGDARICISGGVSVDLLDEARHLPEKKFLDLMLRRTTVKERLLHERKEHLESAGAMLVIAALIASITYQGELQPPPGKHHHAHLLFDCLNGIAFYSAVAATIAVASGSLPIRHMYEIINARNPMRASRGIACVLLIMSSVCVVWAYAAAGFSRASDNKLFPVGNGAGAMATTLFLFWFLKTYIQLHKPFCHSSYGRSSEQNSEGLGHILCRSVAQRMQKLRTVFSRQENGSLQDNLLPCNAEMSSVAV